MLKFVRNLTSLLDLSFFKFAYLIVGNCGRSFELYNVAEVENNTFESTNLLSLELLSFLFFNKLVINNMTGSSVEKFYQYKQNFDLLPDIFL